jgi:membrane-bound metal-dependent hydrolase YbcI (DUF457 family)
MDFDWNSYFRSHFIQVLVCLLVGIASHIFWDAFTHPRGDFVRIIPFLKESLTISGINMYYYRILQYASTIVGGVIVMFSILKIPSSKENNPPNHPLYYWVIIIVMAIIAANVRVLLGVHYTEYATIATSAASGSLVGAIIAPLFLERSAIGPKQV